MRAIRHFRGDLSHFLEGSAHGLLLLDIEFEHTGYIYMVLSEIDARSADVHLPFPHTFESASNYVDIVANCVVASAREALGEASLDLPASCSAANRSPTERLIAILTYARDLLPRGSDSPRLVCTLVPLTIAGKKKGEYLELVRSIIEAEVGFPPWFHRMRIIFSAPIKVTRSWRLGHFARSITVDLSTEALAAGAAADAEDPELADRERSISLLQDATVLFGRKSYKSSSARFHELLTRAQLTEDPVFLAMALIGLGDVEHRRGDAQAALEWYERALEPAGNTAAPIILLNVTNKLAQLYLEKNQNEEAEAFFDGAQQLAGALPEPQTQALSLESRGELQELRGATKAAALSFLEGARVARDNELEVFDRLRSRLQAASCEGLAPEQMTEREELLGSGARA